MQFQSSDDILVTTPFVTTSYGAVVKRETQNKELFAFVSPFETNLWLATIGFMTAAAIVAFTFDVLRHTGNLCPVPCPIMLALS